MCGREWYQIPFSVYHYGLKSSSLRVDRQQILIERKGKFGTLDRVGIISCDPIKEGWELTKNNGEKGRGEPVCKADKLLCLHDTI